MISGSTCCMQTQEKLAFDKLLFDDLERRSKYSRELTDVTFKARSLCLEKVRWNYEECIIPILLLFAAPLL